MYVIYLGCHDNRPGDDDVDLSCFEPEFLNSPLDLDDKGRKHDDDNGDWRSNGVLISATASRERKRDGASDANFVGYTYVPN